MSNNQFESKESPLLQNLFDSGEFQLRQRLLDAGVAKGAADILLGNGFQGCKDSNDMRLVSEQRKALGKTLEIVEQRNVGDFFSRLVFRAEVAGFPISRMLDRLTGYLESHPSLKNDEMGLNIIPSGLPSTFITSGTVSRVSELEYRTPQARRPALTVILDGDRIIITANTAERLLDCYKFERGASSSGHSLQ